ncbi:MAG: class I SAM-dependent rRNA methyltransferase [Armatimonadetes bacterium]|nr:class I SAM-dependent rRNA methyltransferase [Armatimonadota bacterium]
MAIARAVLRKREEHRVAAGHLWVFSNEIGEIRGTPQAGDVVEILSHGGKFLGLGFYNPNSLIAVRLLTRQKEEIAFDFFRKRVEAATILRRKLYGDADSCRLVHGESDFLPGLIVDKYGEHFCIQTLSAGMDRNLPVLCDVLESLFRPKGIIERNDTPLRSHEGLPQKKGLLQGAGGEVVISENGIRYSVNLLEGQKTGFFLDQRENRLAVRRYAGGDVLDCFCNDGGFALNAASSGASRCVGVDSSEGACLRGRRNAELNGLDNRVDFLKADVFEYLDQCLREKRKWDLIVLDPPSFTKSKKSIPQAKVGYRRINSAALTLVKPGGVLATASCSHHIEEEAFLDLVSQCARMTGKTIRLLELLGASPDHPVLPEMPETRYLKFCIFHVCQEK